MDGFSTFGTSPLHPHHFGPDFWSSAESDSRDRRPRTMAFRSDRDLVMDGRPISLAQIARGRLGGFRIEVASSGVGESR